MTAARRLLCGVTAAVLLLGCAHTVALGRGFMFRPGGAITLTTREKFRIQQEEPFEEPIRCDLTLEGSLITSSFVKRAGTVIGSFQRSTVANCEGGELRISGLPVSILYEGFEGTLPNISGIRTSTPDINKLIYEPLTRRNCGYTGAMQFLWTTITLSGMRGIPEITQIPSPLNRLHLEPFGNILNGGFWSCSSYIFLFMSLPLRTSTGGTMTLALI
jgi:hypothetical protein